MMTFTELAPAPSDPPEPFTDRLQLTVAAYLARFKGPSREHTESDLRCYLAWCAERGLDLLAAQHPHLELYVRSMQEIRRFKPSTVSRRFSVAAGFYRTCVIDGIMEHSPAEHVRRPAAPAESPALGFTHLQFEALLTAAMAGDSGRHIRPARDRAAGAAVPPAAGKAATEPLVQARHHRPAGRRTPARGRGHLQQRDRRTAASVPTHRGETHRKPPPQDRCPVPNPAGGNHRPGITHRRAAVARPCVTMAAAENHHLLSALGSGLATKPHTEAANLRGHIMIRTEQAAIQNRQGRCA